MIPIYSMYGRYMNIPTSIYIYTRKIIIHDLCWNMLTMMELFLEISNSCIISQKHGVQRQNSDSREWRDSNRIPLPRLIQENCGKCGKESGGGRTTPSWQCLLISFETFISSHLQASDSLYNIHQLVTSYLSCHICVLCCLPKLHPLYGLDVNLFKL